MGTDTRISHMGPEGDITFGGALPAVAYSTPSTKKMLVVWSGDHTVDDETEIWGQLMETPVLLFIPVVLR